MQIQEIMTKDPRCCTQDTSLREVARMMVEFDCGEIPVVDNQQNFKPVGVVTDRDIVCRAVAEGRDPLELVARDCMTSPAVSVPPETTVEDCCRLMEQCQVRRVLVVDQSGRCCGIVAQADLARQLPTPQVAEVVREVSQRKSAPTAGPSALSS